jgi:hypothetical protein
MFLLENNKTFITFTKKAYVSQRMILHLSLTLLLECKNSGRWVYSTQSVLSITDLMTLRMRLESGTISTS